MAVAGPLVTLAIVVVLTAVGIAAVGAEEFRDAAVLIESDSGVSGVMAMVAWLACDQPLVLVFNLLPAFPMDGGRDRPGDRLVAHRRPQLGDPLRRQPRPRLRLHLHRRRPAAGLQRRRLRRRLAGPDRHRRSTAPPAAAAMQTAITSRISDLRVADVMDREPVAIPGELSVEQALDEYFLRYRWPWFPVVDAAHRFLGLVVRDKADEVPEISRTTSHVSDLLERDDGTFQVRDDAPLDSLLANRALRRFGALMAVDADGRLSGVITAEQVGAHCATRRTGRAGLEASARFAGVRVALSARAGAQESRRWRSMIRPKSVPAGRVPKAWPQSPERREAQKASATASSP